MATIYGTNATEYVNMFSKSATVNTLTTDYKDSIYMYGGDDSVSAGGGDDYVDGWTGNDYANGGYGNDTLWGWSGNDMLYGYAGNDTLRGEDDNDTLMGEDGNDWINGGPGNDALHGGNNDDFLIGGWGMDTLTGGYGADRFQFSKGETGYGTFAADVIKDFKWGQGDKIDLTPTSVSYFGGFDITPEVGEVSYWFTSPYIGNHTVVSFNDEGQVHDILLENLILDMSATRDFII